MTDWRREDEPDVAAARILDAADKAFAELGVASVGMAAVADFAGCSRGTLYRYFKTRHQLHMAYIDRTAGQIVERVRVKTAGIRDPQRRLTEGVLASIAEARRHPGAAAWFEPGVSGSAARISRSSEVIEAFTSKFVGELLGTGKSGADARLRARWLLRVIVSLLLMPGESAREERALIERFATAALI